MILNIPSDVSSRATTWLCTQHKSSSDQTPGFIDQALFHNQSQPSMLCHCSLCLALTKVIDNLNQHYSFNNHGSGRKQRFSLWHSNIPTHREQWPKFHYVRSVTQRCGSWPWSMCTWGCNCKKYALQTIATIRFRPWDCTNSLPSCLWCICAKQALDSFKAALYGSVYAWMQCHARSSCRATSHESSLHHGATILLIWSWSVNWVCWNDPSKPPLEGTMFVRRHSLRGSYCNKKIRPV